MNSSVEEEITRGIANMDSRISDIHLEEFARSLLRHWRSLPSHLGLEEIVVNDIERRCSDEPGRRREFLQIWRQRFGSRATYRKLIQAVLIIGSTEDAEVIGRLLRRSMPPEASSLPGQGPRPRPRGRTAVAPRGTTRFPHLNLGTMSEEEQRRLVIRLEEESENITLQYARLVVLTAASLAERGTTIDELRTFFSCGLREVADSIHPSDSVRNVIDRLIQQNYLTFFNYKLLAGIINAFCSNEIGRELANYESCFSTYCQRRIFEVPAAALSLAASSASQQPLLVLKFDERFNMSDSLHTIHNIRHRIEQLLGLEYLNLVDVRNGCVELRFRYFAEHEDVLVAIKQKLNDFLQLGVKQLQCGQFYVRDQSHSNSGTTLPDSIGPKTQPQQKQKKVMAAASKVAGQRRGVKRRKSSPASFGISVMASDSIHSELLQAVQKKRYSLNVSDSSSDTDSEQPPKKKAHSIVRCPAHLAYLCEVCYKKDCGTCLNCLIRDQDGQHLCCEKKQADRCLTYLKMMRMKKQEANKGASKESEGSLQPPTEHKGSFNAYVSANLSKSLSEEIFQNVPPTIINSAHNAKSIASSVPTKPKPHLKRLKSTKLEPALKKTLPGKMKSSPPVISLAPVITLPVSLGSHGQGLGLQKQGSPVQLNPGYSVPLSPTAVPRLVEPHQSQQSLSGITFQKVTNSLPGQGLHHQQQNSSVQTNPSYSMPLSPTVVCTLAEPQQPQQSSNILCSGTLQKEPHNTSTLASQGQSPGLQQQDSPTQFHPMPLSLSGVEPEQSQQSSSSLGSSTFPGEGQGLGLQPHDSPTQLNPTYSVPSSSTVVPALVESQQSFCGLDGITPQGEACATSSSGGTLQGVCFPEEISHTSSILLSQSSQGDNDEDDELDKIIENILMQGLADGKVKLQIIKCGVSGPPETGKTHVRALMLGRRRPRQRRSTAVAEEADQATPDYLRFDEKFDEKMVNMTTTRKGNVWRVIQEGTMAGIIAKTLHNKDYRKIGAEDSVSEPTLRSELRQRCKVIRTVLSELRKMQGNPKMKKKGLNDIRLVYFVDTGGQPQFQEILPKFVKCDINLLVHNLSQDLAHCPEFNYVVDGKRFTVPEQMRLSNIDIIEQSVRSITSSIGTSESKPSVAIVGTFKDQCDPGSDQYKQMLKDKTAEINKQLQSYLGYGRDKCGIISPGRSQDQRIFAIDASEQGWESNLDSLEALKSHILESAKKNPVEVPIRYFLFLQCLRDFCKNKSSGKGQYVTLNECYHVASVNDIAMTQLDVKKALELFDSCNLILYFPSILENIAFVKPGFLFGMVTDLIVASFQCELGTTEDHEYFQNTGIFSKRILNDVTSHKLLDEQFTQKHFLDLLKGLFIIAEVDRGQYFMPCVLPLEKASEEVKSTMECMKSNGIDGPLMLSFPQKMSPRGLFCALVVALVADFSWQLSPLSEGIHRRRNLVEFEVVHHSNHIGQATVIDRKSHFEVFTTCDPSYCPWIKQAVTGAFETACDNMNYRDSKTVGLPCRSCKEPQPHSTEVVQIQEGGIWKERCSIHKRRKQIPLTRDRLWWFKDMIPQNNTQEFLKLLCSEVATRTNEWRAIALNLNLDSIMVNRIALECRDDIQECFVRVFEQWRRQCEPPYTLNTIINALEQPSVNEAALAQELREKYCDN